MHPIKHNIGETLGNELGGGVMPFSWVFCVSLPHQIYQKKDINSTFPQMVYKHPYIYLHIYISIWCYRHHTILLRGKKYSENPVI